MKFRVAEIFPSERQFRLGRVALRLGNLQVANRGVMPLLGVKSVFQQGALPRLFRPRPGQLGLGCQQSGLRRLDLASCPLVVEWREEVAPPNARADIDRPGENLPAD